MLIRKFEEQAAKTPDRIAVKSRENWITYRELHACALRVCRAIMSSPLRTTGEESGTVGLLFRHGTDMIAAVLGTLKAGKIYVPLSADYPKNRLAYMVTHSRASLILTAGECETEARVLAVESGISFLNIDDFREPVPAPNPPAPAEADRLAYIMYTSGSTGKPKGVKQNLGNVWYYTRNWIERFGINQEDRMTLFSSFCHDGSVQDMFSALLSGAALYPLDMKSRDGTEALSRFLVKERITVWHSVPSLYTYFTGTLNGEDRGDEYKELRIILLGGEPVREHEIAMRGKYFPRALLANVYGQTESSVNSIWLVRPGDAVNNFVIGEPLDETEIFVVDADGNEVAGLRSGEIVVACAHLSPGYWRDEAAGQSPFETDDEMGPMYWTGDTGRLLPDGRIEFTGRLDAQVKIRGFRIEPGEIESQLLRHEQIKEAVVIDREEAQ
ncbi:MAG: amino acid adenylation domain-containing protein, partial [bacterium]|nr:amino acid adenylation domain-containing protein [bacterium]